MLAAPARAAERRRARRVTRPNARPAGRGAEEQRARMDRIVRLYRRGGSLLAVAERTGVAPPVVWRTLAKRGVPRRTEGVEPLRLKAGRLRRPRGCRLEVAPPTSARERDAGPAPGL